ncbi:unnamed protein product [Arctogadus glacialis]
MWVCNLCRKQQEILTKSGAWFYGPGPGQAFEGGPQGKKARLQDPSLYPYHQGAPGDTSTLPASQRGRPRGGLLPRQSSLDNGTTSRYSGSGDLLIDRSCSTPGSEPSKWPGNYQMSGPLSRGSVPTPNVAS